MPITLLFLMSCIKVMNPNQMQLQIRMNIE